MTQDPGPIDNNILRLLIREAVERETANVVAPLRTGQQVLDGIIKQFNRDVTLLQTQFFDLDELVRGNPKQNLIGLAEQINAIRSELATEIKGLREKLDEADKKRDALINQWRGARYALIALGIITGLPYLDRLGQILHLLP